MMEGSDYDALFRVIDTDQSGEISLAEFHAFCETLTVNDGTGSKLTAAVVQRLFQQADTDESGFIDPTEFSALCEGVKLLVRMTETEMVEGYATMELKRLFSYLAAEGTQMRRDELRKALDIVNEGLNIGMSVDVLNPLVRDFCGREEEVDFSGFLKAIQKIAQGKPLTAVASAFKEEEARRKERLSKMKSIFERGASQGGRARAPSMFSAPRKPADAQSTSSGGQGQNAGPCTACEQHQRQALDAKADLTRAQAKIRELEDNLEKGQAQTAANVVDQQRKYKQLQQEMEAAKEQMQKQQTAQQATANEMATLEKELKHLKEESEKLQKEAAKCAKLEKQSEQQQDDCRQLRRELEQSIAREQAAVQEAQAITSQKAASEQKLTSLQTELERLQGVLNELSHSKDEESVKAKKIISEMKKQCEDRENAAKIAEKEAIERSNAFHERETAVVEREDAVTKREHEVKKRDAENRKRWETTFVAAEKRLAELEERLNQREIEVGTKEAEISVKENLVEQRIRRQEQCSLPERERRFRLLQDIEKELCQRERKLRQAESNYIQQLLHPELDRLREDNRHLKTKIKELMAEKEASMGGYSFTAATPVSGRRAAVSNNFQQQGNNRGTPSPPRYSIDSPSYKLL